MVGTAVRPDLVKGPTMPQQTETDERGTDEPGTSPLLTAIMNLSKYHREHEKYYASAPREQAVVLQRHARSLLALADRWSTTPPTPRAASSPFEGAPDLNAAVAVQLDGILFMEGSGEPAEIARMKRDLRLMADDAAATGDWLEGAMQSSWVAAESLLDVGELADVFGERHRIIANDGQAALLSGLVGKLLRRAVEVLDRVEFEPAALRKDLAGANVSAKLMYSAAEIVGHAADLLSDSAALDGDNERRWRVFRSRVREVVATSDAPTGETVPAAR
jgi:hypothetical protein